MTRPLSAPQSVRLGFAFDTHVYNNLNDYFRPAVLNQDWDCALLVDGTEGSGKSMYAGQLAKVLDVDNEVDLHTQVHWEADEVEKAIKTLKSGKAIIWDEAGDGLARREGNRSVTMKILKMLWRSRAYNKFLIIVMPSFYDMDRMVALRRSRALFHIDYEWDASRKEKPLVRGIGRFYTENGKAKLWKIHSKGDTPYEYVFIRNESFNFRIAHHWVFDHEEYKRLKKEADERYYLRAINTTLACPVCQSTNIRATKTRGKTCRTCAFAWDVPLAVLSPDSNKKGSVRGGAIDNE